MRKFLWSLVGVGLLCSAVPAWSTPESRAAAQFLLFQPSARSAGMGGAFVAIADDANATYYNPAALADDTSRTTSITYFKPVPKLADDIYTLFMGYTQPVNGVGNLGLSITYTKLGEQFRTNQQGQELGSFTSWSTAIGISYGSYVYKKISLGLSVKFIHENLAGQGAGIEAGKGAGTSFGADVGFLWQASDRTTVGWALRNIGPSMTFIDADQSDPLPQSFTIGTAYKIYRSGNSTVLVTTDIYKQLANEGFFSFVSGWSDSPPAEELKDIDYKVGTEWGYRLSEGTAFALRAGYFHDQDGKRNSPTFGLGILYNWLSFDLSYFAKTSSPAGNSFRTTMSLAL